MSNRPIPTRTLIPIAFACLIVTALVLFGAPDLILIPIATITVAWAAGMVVRHYLRKKKET